jgi:hypothetical protein
MPIGPKNSTDVLLLSIATAPEALSVDRSDEEGAVEPSLGTSLVLTEVETTAGAFVTVVDTPKKSSPFGLRSLRFNGFIRFTLLTLLLSDFISCFDVFTAGLSIGGEV